MCSIIVNIKMLGVIYRTIIIIAFLVVVLNITSAIRFTDTLADGCENGHVFCE